MVVFNASATGTHIMYIGGVSSALITLGSAVNMPVIRGANCSSGNASGFYIVFGQIGATTFQTDECYYNQCSTNYYFQAGSKLGYSNICQPCPCMDDINGVSRCGNSAGTGYLASCMMSTSYIFPDTYGNFNFATACPAS
jgi:hypothetical protein